MRKEEYLRNYYELIEPFVCSEELKKGRIAVTGEVAHFGEKIAQNEGFLRLLWAEAFNVEGRSDEYFKNLCQGILSGTNKQSKYFWGEIPDYGQLFVEMVSLSVFLIESKSDFWDQLNDEQKESIATYLNQITDADVPPNNWQLFKMMVQTSLYKLDSPYFNKTALDKAIETINTYYIGDGFYTDGKNNSKDYYISWGFHYYGLLYDRYMSEFDPENAGVFILRTNLYLPAYLAHFDSDGIAVPYGRSLSYRFAQGALLSMVALNKKIQIDRKILSHLIAGHLNYWMNSNMRKPDGTLAVGYTYPNILMAENYNSAGSTYWAFKFFAMLSCPAEDEIFTNSKAALKPERFPSKTGNFISERTVDQTFFYPVNNTAGTDGYKDKYHKFVYSTKFGFSVSKGLLQLYEGAFDNTLAIKDLDTGVFLTKLSETSFEILADKIVFTWSPKQGVKINTTIIPNGNTHERIHEITTEFPLEIYDMGFANDALVKEELQIIKNDNFVSITSPYGKTESHNLNGYDELVVDHTFPSTHLLFKKAVITGLKATLIPGDYIFRSLHNAHALDK